MQVEKSWIKDLRQQPAVSVGRSRNPVCYGNKEGNQGYETGQ